MYYDHVDGGNGLDEEKGNIGNECPRLVECKVAVTIRESIHRDK